MVRGHNQQLARKNSLESFGYSGELRRASRRAENRRFGKTNHSTLLVLGSSDEEPSVGWEQIECAEACLSILLNEAKAATAPNTVQPLEDANDTAHTRHVSRFQECG